MKAVAFVTALLALVALQQFAILPWDGRLGSGLQNGLHGVWFAVVTVIVYALVRRRIADSSALAVTAAAALAGAIGTEWLQSVGARDAEWSDVAMDLLGAGAALTLLAARGTRRWRWPARSMAAVLLLASMAPALLALAIHLHRAAIAPALVDLSAYRFGGLLMSTCELRVLQGTEGMAALEVVLDDGCRPEIYLPEPIPDWRGFESLTVDVSVAESAAPVGLHVWIRLGAREEIPVGRAFTVPAGRTTLRVQIRELFDPTTRRVSAVVLAATRPPMGRRFVLHGIRLEPARS